MIKPTVSRAVWFRPGPACGIPVSDQPLHATIIRVIDDRRVNLLVVDGTDGAQYFKTGVQLIQHGDKIPNDGPFCVWPEVHRPATPPSDLQSRSANDAVSKASDPTVHDAPPVHREPVNLEQAERTDGELIGHADASAASDASLDAAQKSEATAPSAETAAAQ